jgi:sugar lactone lactonase YvrE
MSIEILDDTRSELGEGPTYDPAQNKAWWFDIRGKKLFEHDFAGQRTTIH